MHELCSSTYLMFSSDATYLSDNQKPRPRLWRVTEYKHLWTTRHAVIRVWHPNYGNVQWSPR